MKFEVRKSGEEFVLDLPDEVVAKLGRRQGDILAVEIIGGRLQIARVHTFHDRAMEFARRGFVKYRETFEALAKS